jgi:hypothetical protein
MKMEVELHAFLTSALDGNDWSTLHPDHFILKEIDPIIHQIEGWVSPIVSTDTLEGRRIP